MFENLTQKLENALSTLKGHGKITEINVAQTLKEVRRTLISADVSYKVAKSFTDKVLKNALGENVLSSIKPGQLLIKIIKDELTELMGGEMKSIDLKGKNSIFLISGLQGSGKTTFSAKLANYIKLKTNKKILLVACDIYRPAAIEQLKVLAKSIDVDVYSEDNSYDPVQISKNAKHFALENNYEYTIIDTAGRLSIDEKMMNEILNIKKIVNPNETLFVVDSMTGQDAVNTAKIFNDVLNFDGIILTKLDGDTRGGAALTIKSIVNKPIKFIGTGEKISGIELFYPNRMAERILGMGDVISLVEKAQAQFDENQARKLSKKIAKNNFDFNDFLDQIKKIKKMGNFKDLISMMPGFSSKVNNLDIDEDPFKKFEVIINSMTKNERSNPKIIDLSRRKRIAKGSGINTDEINQLLKKFEGMGKILKKIQMGGMNNMINMFKNKFK